MKNSLIIALDFTGKEEVNRFLSKFNDEQLFLKVGMELFYQEGPRIVQELKEKGHQVFLDLKLHDIPNTVGKAMERLARLQIDLVNVHAAGGKEMMERALAGLEAGTLSSQKRPNLIGVTQLTSTSEEQMQKEQLISATLKESVLQYASLTKEAGLDGVVCSAFESEEIKRLLGSGFLTVTPGIRTAADEQGDQKRIATPAFAKEAGASAIVVGRSITNDPNPLEKYKQMKSQWEGVLQ
ncbi:orotidine-5'-phosphate decarboxylase [Cytobacillus gottheilii]|uniref:orotidine-5'-phosphate decarboxylase n=1 Tax=Cytobacillus gottheilii TaxID=859144 RepID=UPI0009BB3119|nr:orotidine-5'-phosphate decarboxylase [Cytobacillus gottheilii]